MTDFVSVFNMDGTGKWFFNWIYLHRFNIEIVYFHIITNKSCTPSLTKKILSSHNIVMYEAYNCIICIILHYIQNHFSPISGPLQLHNLLNLCMTAAWLNPCEAPTWAVRFREKVRELCRDRELGCVVFVIRKQSLRQNKTVAFNCLYYY